MKLTPIPFIALAITFCTVLSAAAIPEPKPIPHIAKRGNSRQLIVDGKPFLVLGGELHNSSSTSMAYMQPIWKRLSTIHMNTVLAAVAWELIEPEEGKFDFSLVDGLLKDARKNNMRLSLLWFGSWKNGLSHYAPAWVKKDYNGFRACVLQVIKLWKH